MFIPNWVLIVIELALIVWSIWILIKLWWRNQKNV